MTRTLQQICEKRSFQPPIPIGTWVWAALQFQRRHTEKARIRFYILFIQTLYCLRQTTRHNQSHLEIVSGKGMPVCLVSTWRRRHQRDGPAVLSAEKA
jgi:hypothetical protein